MTTYTDKLIEAMARADRMACALDVMDSGWAARKWDTPGGFHASDRAPYFERARAALVAQLKFMIEHGPSEEQLDGARDWSLRKNGLGVGNDQATGCYQAMCRALLAELEGP